MKKEEMKPIAMGAVGGAVVLAIVLFASGMAVTSSSAEQNARMMSQNAVTERLADICVARFESSPNRDDQLDVLKAKDSWNRAEYVSEQGWATMPDKDSANTQVARECALRLARL